METLEDLQIFPPGRHRPPSHRQLAHNPVDVLRGHLPRPRAQRGERALQQPGVVVDRYRAEPARPPRRHYALRLKLPRVHSHRLDWHTTLDHPQPRPGSSTTPHLCQTSGDSIRLSQALTGQGVKALT
jgi:hypothetical protein